MYVISINVRPHDIRGLHKFPFTDLKLLSINAHPLDVRKSVDVMSESGIPGLNGLIPESALNVLNGLNILGPESAQEHINVFLDENFSIQCQIVT